MFNCEERTNGGSLNKLKSWHFGQDESNMRMRYLKFVYRLQKDSGLASKFDFYITQPALMRKVSKKKSQGKGDSVMEIEQVYELPKLMNKTSIECRMTMEEESDSDGQFSSGLLLSQYFHDSDVDVDSLLHHTERLKLDHFEELFQYNDVQIGLTSLVLLCQYVNGRRVPYGHYFRLFLVSTLIAYKLTYEIVSNNLGAYICRLAGCGLDTLNTLYRHFLRQLSYQMKVTPHNIKKLMILLIE